MKKKNKNLIDNFDKFSYSKKLIICGYVVIIFILLIGAFSLHSMYRFSEDSNSKTDLIDFVSVLDHLIIDSFLLIETENLEDYNDVKAEIEFDKMELDLLHHSVYPVLIKYDLEGQCLRNLEDYRIISESLIDIQKQTLLKGQEFSENAKIEKEIRHKFTDLSIDLGDFEMMKQVSDMRYKSKEALYQYKDEKHLKQWYSEIEDVKKTLLEMDLPEDEKEQLLEDLDSYKIVALNMGEIVTMQNEIRADEENKIHELYEIVERIDHGREEISGIINENDRKLARNTFTSILAVSLLGIALIAAFFLRRKK